MPLISLQDIVNKSTRQRKTLRETLDSGSFHPSTGSVLQGQNREDLQNIKETLRTISLSYLIKKSGAIKEFLGKSGTTGIAGAAYLIPDKIYDIYFDAARTADIVPLVSTMMECPGSTLQIDLEIDGQFNPHFFGAGGAQPTETIETNKVDITPRLFGINPEITYELIEDSQFDVVEMHIRGAGRAMGELSTKMWLYLPMQEHASASTFGGDGTLNTQTGTSLSDLAEAEQTLALDGFPMDTVIIAPTGALAAWWAPESNWSLDWNVPFNLSSINLGQIWGCNVIRPLHLEVTAGTPIAVSTAFKTAGLYATHWHNVILNKMNATATVRKRWLKIENYSNPIKDLAGSSVTARQDSNMLYRDAVCVQSHA